MLTLAPLWVGQASHSTAISYWPTFARSPGAFPDIRKCIHSTRYNYITMRRSKLLASGLFCFCLCGDACHSLVTCALPSYRTACTHMSLLMSFLKCCLSVGAASCLSYSFGPLSSSHADLRSSLASAAAACSIAFCYTIKASNCI